MRALLSVSLPSTGDVLGLFDLDEDGGDVVLAALLVRSLDELLARRRGCPELPVTMFWISSSVIIPESPSEQRT
jgi:hypothetical protein